MQLYIIVILLQLKIMNEWTTNMLMTNTVKVCHGIPIYDYDLNTHC